MSRSFTIRKINSHYNSLQNHINQPLLVYVDPCKAQFFQYEKDKINVVKIRMYNKTNNILLFNVIQPNNSILQVKYKENTIQAKSNIQFFLFLYPNQNKYPIEDIFVIQFQKYHYQIVLPILIQHRSLSKELVDHAIYNQNQNKPFKLIHQKNNNIILNNPFKNSKKISFTKKINHKIQINHGLVEKYLKIDDIVNIFFVHFNYIEQFTRGKNVKNRVFIGQYPITNEKIGQIRKFKAQLQNIINQSLHQKALYCFNLQYSQQGPIIQSISNLSLQWDFTRNNPYLTTSKAIQKFQQEVRKLIIQYRFNKIHRAFECYKQYYKNDDNKHKIESQQDNQYQRYLKKQIQNSNTTKYEINFDSQNLQPQQITLLYTNQQYHHKFDINARVSFDNWISNEQTDIYCHQTMNYNKMQSIPEWFCHYQYKNDDIIQNNSQNNDSFLKIESNKQIENWNTNYDYCSNQEQIIENKYRAYKLQQYQDYLFQISTNNEISQNRIHTHSLQILSPIQYFKYQFQPYYDCKFSNTFSQYFSNQIKIIDYSQRQDQFTLQRSTNIQSYLYNHIVSHSSNKNEKIQNQIDCSIINNMKVIQKFPHIIQNLALLKLRKLSIAIQHIQSYNKYITNLENQILF